MQMLFEEADESGDGSLDRKDYDMMLQQYIYIYIHTHVLHVHVKEK